MTLDTRSDHAPVTRRTVRVWGELSPSGEVAHALRLVLLDRIVTYITEDIRRWEHLLGEPEQLILSAGRDTILIEGDALTELRVALELRRLTEIRVSVPSLTRPGPRIRAITIESA